MSSKIKVDTIENVAGSGNVSLGSGHNLVVPGNITGQGTAAITSNATVGGTLAVTGATTLSNTLSVPLANSNNPSIRLESPTTDVDFAISSYNDANGTYVSLGANHYLNSGGNDAVFDTNKKSAGILLDARNNGRIQFLTANTGVATSRMEVSKDGHITKPSQPSFMARNHGQVANNAAYVQATPLVCYTIDHNIGNHYSTSNGRFTAPVAGRYMYGFSFGITRTDNNETLHPYFVKNGSQYHYQYYAPSGLTNLHAPISFSACINLAAGDYLATTVGGSGDWYAGLQETMMWGYLIG